MLPENRRQDQILKSGIYIFTFYLFWVYGYVLGMYMDAKYTYWVQKTTHESLFSFPLPWSWTQIIRLLCRSLFVEVCFPSQPFIFYSGIIHTFIHSWRKIRRKWSSSKCSCNCSEESTGHRECQVARAWGISSNPLASVD